MGREKGTSLINGELDNEPCGGQEKVSGTEWHLNSAYAFAHLDLCRGGGVSAIAGSVWGDVSRAAARSGPVDRQRYARPDPAPMPKPGLWQFVFDLLARVAHQFVDCFFRQIVPCPAIGTRLGPTRLFAACDAPSDPPRHRIPAGMVRAEALREKNP
jgi:hypothetical protein